MNPNKVRILGVNFDINYHQITHENGVCRTSESIIEVSTYESSEENQRSTLLHEIIEAINAMLELNLEHTKICSLEASLFQIIRDNHDIFDYLRE